ncbi:MAG: NAD-dependent epimerase/dehydratase family protein [bacterium]|nr:NAD-dependent epimerase/dehydratase family protein [bacterium]
MTQRILVTGGAGFIGSHIVDELLRRGHHPIVFDNESTGTRANLPSGVEFIPGDVCDSDALKTVFESGVDAVMHLAGQASIRISFANPDADLNVNTLGTVRVLQQCLAYRVPRLIFASTMTVYGDTPVTPTPEDAPPNPISFYAVTKYAAERYVHITAARGDLDFEFHATALRMFNVYGPRQRLNNPYQGVLAIFIGNVMRGEPIKIFSDGEQSRDFVHAVDAAKAWADALDNPATYGQSINIGTGVGTSVNQLCDYVVNAFGHTRDTYPVQYFPTHPGDMRHSRADISRAKALIGWSPQIDMAEGMAETVAWARQEAAREEKQRAMSDKQ